ncbi:hypothetical protein FDUTEX481_03182 [Tolypothrix sp. PCC 7601]|nr:hypothetical protein FDUTEX481_03182 [Tolypothrix sp. PCC 7601]
MLTVHSQQSTVNSQQSTIAMEYFLLGSPSGLMLTAFFQSGWHIDTNSLWSKYPQLLIPV